VENKSKMMSTRGASLSAASRVINVTALKGKKVARVAASHPSFSSMPFKPQKFVLSSRIGKKVSTSPSYLPLRAAKSKNVMPAARKVKNIASATSVILTHPKLRVKDSKMPTSLKKKRVSLPISHKHTKSSGSSSKKILFKPLPARKNVFSPAIKKKSKHSSHATGKKLKK